VRVVLADDNVLLREAIAGLLEGAGFEIVGRAGDAGGLMALVRTQHPDLAVVDIRMPPGQSTEGLAAAMTIRRELPETGIVVLSAFVYAEHAVELQRPGHFRDPGERRAYHRKYGAAGHAGAGRLHAW
jgi:DNA-binding NarL/FixJ family response regulator